jgi:hypothetical protein
MTHHDDHSLLEAINELLEVHGFDGPAKALTVLLYETKKAAELCQWLQTEDGEDAAGRLAAYGTTVREGDSYTASLERAALRAGLRTPLLGRYTQGDVHIQRLAVTQER